MNEKVNTMNNNLVLEVDGLSTEFIYKNRTAKAVRDVSFTLEKGIDQMADTIGIM